MLPAMSVRELEFFFDVGSPYSYLAATRMGGVAERTGAAVRWRPFLLGAVFKETGNEPPARLPAKAKWMLADLHRWAARWGVDFKFPSQFPRNTLKPQRALVVVAQREPDQLPDFALALFRGYWVEDRDVSDPEVISAIASAAGLDGEAIVAATAEQSTKDTLKSWTAEAVARGAFGAPTFFVGDEMHWGNDRLELVEASLGA